MINRDQFPPGGWQFYQPETKWNAPSPLNYDFYSMARLIQQHRAANNLSADYEKAVNDLEAYTRARFPSLYSGATTTTTTNVQPRVSGCRTCGR